MKVQSKAAARIHSVTSRGTSIRPVSTKRVYSQPPVVALLVMLIYYDLQSGHFLIYFPHSTQQAKCPHGTNTMDAHSFLHVLHNLASSKRRISSNLVLEDDGIDEDGRVAFVSR